jgi:hypothetical protein
MIFISIHISHVQKSPTISILLSQQFRFSSSYLLNLYFCVPSRRSCPCVAFAVLVVVVVDDGNGDGEEKQTTTFMRRLIHSRIFFL